MTTAEAESAGVVRDADVLDVVANALAFRQDAEPSSVTGEEAGTFGADTTLSESEQRGEGGGEGRTRCGLTQRGGPMIWHRTTATVCLTRQQTGGMPVRSLVRSVGAVMAAESEPTA